MWLYGTDKENMNYSGEKTHSKMKCPMLFYSNTIMRPDYQYYITEFCSGMQILLFYACNKKA
jgi:hypothetical protein